MLNKCRPKTGDDQAAPLAVFYVVETSGQVMGERHHRVCSHLFETTLQAHAELARLELANASGAFSIWKGTTYIEPAEWLYDVIMADGTVIPARRGQLLPSLHTFTIAATPLNNLSQSANTIGRSWHSAMLQPSDANDSTSAPR